MSQPDDQNVANLISALNELVARQQSFEERLSRLEHSLGVPAPPPKQPEPALVKPVLARIEQPAPEPPMAQEAAFEARFGLTLLNRIGVVTLVLGVAFFFKWAADNNWVGPLGRVVLGLIAGLLTLGFADSLWRKGQQTFAQGITGAGIAISYIACYAAFDFYHLIPQTVAFLLLLATTILASVLALRYSSIAISALGLFGAYLIPLLLSNGEDHPWFLLSYLLLLSVAATRLASRSKWELLEVISFAASALIFGSWLADNGHHADNRPAATVGILALCGQRYWAAAPILFLLAQVLAASAIGFVWEGSDNQLWLSILFAAGGLAYSHVRSYRPVAAAAAGAFWLSLYIWSWSDTGTHVALAAALGFLLFHAWNWWRIGVLNEPVTEVSLAMLALNGVAYYALAYGVLRNHYHQWLGLLAVVVAAAYFLFALSTRRRENGREASLLALGMASAFVTLAIPIQLSGFTVSMAWSIQAAALNWVGLRMKNRRLIIAGLVIFALAFLHVAFFDSRMYAGTHVFHLVWNARFFSFAVLGGALLLSAYWAARVERQLSLAPFIAGHVAILGGLTLEVLEWAKRSTRPENLLSVETIGITILFAAYAVLLVSVGVAARSALSRVAGLVLTAIVIVKLYLFDVWQLGRVYQIIAFVILGILLLSTSFLYSRFKGLLEQWRKDAT